MILIDWAQTHKNKKIDVISESIPHLDDGAIKDFKTIMTERHYWNDNLWNSTQRVYTFETGTIIKFKSVDKLGKSKGPRRDVLFINEANNIDWEIVDQLMVRTQDIIWMDWNPTYEFWYYTEIKDKREHDFITLTYLDCIETLSQNIIDDIESHKNNKNWWQVYGLGKLGEIEGRIYSNWQFIDEIPENARLERYGLDFGYSNDPTAIVAVYYCDNRWILSERLYRKGMGNKEIADTLKTIDERLVIADCAEPKSIDEIRAYGVNIQPCQKGKDSIRQGIQLIQDQLISVTKASVNLIKEYRNYLWMTDKNGRFIQPNEPEKGNDHALDAARYAMETLGRIEQEKNHWDRIFEKKQQQQINNFDESR
jgi:phage terminase large subunit